MPALLVYYIIGVGVGNINFLIPAAIIFSWGGDALLINKDKPIFFKLGLASFLISHIFYIIAFLGMAAGRLNYLALIISAVVAIPVIIFILKLVKAPKPMKIPVAAYAIVIMLMSMAALQLMLASGFNFAGILIFAASVVFIFSDSFMAYLLFNGKPKHYNVITMIPYIIAQAGIIMGVVFMSN